MMGDFNARLSNVSQRIAKASALLKTWSDEARAASAEARRAGAGGGKRQLHEIARDIQRDWKNPHFAARPYLGAMHSLSHVGENYGADSGKSVVAYFLSNASSWKGPKAKEIKAELKQHLKG